MIGPILLAAAMLSPESAARDARPAQFRPSGGATARATASARILSGIRFGPGQRANISGAGRRATRLIDETGQTKRLEILEFQ